MLVRSVTKAAAAAAGSPMTEVSSAEDGMNTSGWRTAHQPVRRGRPYERAKPPPPQKTKGEIRDFCVASSCRARSAHLS
jgi:hypothetical protein